MAGLHTSLNFDIGSSANKGVCANIVTTGTTGIKNEKSCSTWSLERFCNGLQKRLPK